jgi:hypothetical protein
MIDSVDVRDVAVPRFVTGLCVLFLFHLFLFLS